MSAYVGWDLGGAHLKAAWVEKGQVKAVWQLPCPLWRGLSYFEQALESVLIHLPRDSVHGLTMTGEMVDWFDHREQGINVLLDTFSQKLQRLRERIFLFVDFNIIPLTRFNPQNHKIASTNWKITAQYLQTKEPNALCLDIGSTTCDLIPICAGKLLSQGEDDHTRLRHGELIYTGVIRTSLATLTPIAPFDGEWIPLMAEHFATTGDVYRILRLLPEYADQAETADGKPKTPAASMQRLARTIGLDRHMAEDSAWIRLAEYFNEIQLQSLALACLRQLSRGFSDHTVIVGAGVGRFLVKTLAQRLRLEYRDIAEYFPCAEDAVQTGFCAADCTPAAALACLLAAHFGS